MDESKKLSRQTSRMLVIDVLIALWDMGLATYNFVKGRWILGILLVAAVVLLLWAAKWLLESKHDTERMRMRHEYVMEVIKSVDKQRFAEEVSNEDLTSEEK